MADGELDQKKQQFEDTQLGALKVPGNPENIGEVLASAENIGMISKDVVEKIKDDKALSEVLGVSFKKTFDKAKVAALAKMKDDTEKSPADKEKISNAKAFREAFRMVYGRFLLEEHDDALDTIDKSSADLLRGVLKFPIEDKDKLKGRSELKSAFRRLRELSAGGSSSVEIGKKIAASVEEAEDNLVVAKDNLVTPRKDLEATKADLVAARSDFDSIEFNYNSQKAVIDVDIFAAETELKDAMEGLVELEGLVDADTIIGSKQIETATTKITTAEKKLRLAKKATPDALAYEKAKFEAKAKVGRLEKEIGLLEKEIGRLEKEVERLEKELEAAKKVTPVSWVLDKAFPKAKSGAEIKGLERVHEEATGKQKDVRTTYEYFAHHHNLEVFLDAHNSYEKIVGGTTKLGTGEGFYAKRAEAKRNFEVTDKALKDLYEPNEASLSRTLAEMLKSHIASGGDRSKFDAVEKRGQLITDYDTRKNKYTKDIIVYEEDKDVYDNIFDHAAKLHTETKKLVQNLEAAQKLSIPFEDGFDARAVVERFKKYEPKSRSFNPIEFLAYSEELRGYFGNHHKVEHLQQAFDAKLAESEKKVKDAKKALDKANEANEKSKNLTDDAAAKKIIGAIVHEQFPDISAMEHNKLVSMILADDVATLQTDEGYEALAQRGSAEKFEALKFAGFRGKLLNFKYKEGDRVMYPFKGLKPDNFQDWASMEKLFVTGKLNYKNGFFVLAALEDFDGGVKSIQAVQLEKKLKALLAKQLGVDTHMDKAGISKVIDDAFKAQMDKIRPIMKAHFDLVSDKSSEANGHKKEVLDIKYADLNDQLRTNKISHEVYEDKLKALIKEAKESEVEVEFSLDSAMSGYWHSKEAQELRDVAHDVGEFLGKKALALGAIAPGKIMLKGAWGATKLGTSLVYQGAMLPVRAAKYPLLLAAKPVVGFINLFRKSKLTPLPGIRDSLKNDAARVIGYSKEKASGTVKGATEAVTKTTTDELGKVKYTSTKYADRNKDEAAQRAELLKIHEHHAELEPIELGESPFVDLAKYKEQIGVVTKALGITVSAHSGPEPKVGHEETAKAETHEKPEEKKDDHAHGHH